MNKKMTRWALALATTLMISGCGLMPLRETRSSEGPWNKSRACNHVFEDGEWTGFVTDYRKVSEYTTGSILARTDRTTQVSRRYIFMALALDRSDATMWKGLSRQWPIYVESNIGGTLLRNGRDGGRVGGTTAFLSATMTGDSIEGVRQTFAFVIVLPPSISQADFEAALPYRSDPRTEEVVLERGDGKVLSIAMRRHSFNQGIVGGETLYRPAVSAVISLDEDTELGLNYLLEFLSGTGAHPVTVTLNARDGSPFFSDTLPVAELARLMPQVLAKYNAFKKVKSCG